MISTCKLMPESGWSQVKDESIAALRYAPGMVGFCFFSVLAGPMNNSPDNKRYESINGEEESVRNNFRTGCSMFDKIAHDRISSP
jgi:hypothetical protein